MPKVKQRIKSKNVVVKIDLNVPTEKILDTRTVNILGNTMIKKIKQFLMSGTSPVTGKKFQLYKNPEKYPKNVRKDYPSKKNTPVNLKLSGNLYESFGFIKKSAMVLTFGLLQPKGKVDIYGAVHNRDDTRRPDIPERKFLPTKPGETFNKTILLDIRRVIVERIRQIIK
jgi:hypothetical protein